MLQAKGWRGPEGPALVISDRGTDLPRGPARPRLATRPSVGYSNAKMRFQSFFMLMTIQPSFTASS